MSKNRAAKAETVVAEEKSVVSAKESAATDLAAKLAALQAEAKAKADEAKALAKAAREEAKAAMAKAREEEKAARAKLREEEKAAREAAREAAKAAKGLGDAGVNRVAKDLVFELGDGAGNLSRFEIAESRGISSADAEKVAEAIIGHRIRLAHFFGEWNRCPEGVCMHPPAVALREKAEASA